MGWMEQISLATPLAQPSLGGFKATAGDKMVMGRDIQAPLLQIKEVRSGSGPGCDSGGANRL